MLAYQRAHVHYLSYLLTRISAVKHHTRIQLSAINIFKSNAWFVSILTKANSP